MLPKNVENLLVAGPHYSPTPTGQQVSVALYNSMLGAQMQESAMIMIIKSIKRAVVE